MQRGWHQPATNRVWIGTGVCGVPSQIMCCRCCCCTQAAQLASRCQAVSREIQGHGERCTRGHTWWEGQQCQHGLRVANEHAASSWHVRSLVLRGVQDRWWGRQVPPGAEITACEPAHDLPYDDQGTVDETRGMSFWTPADCRGVMVGTCLMIVPSSDPVQALLSLLTRKLVTSWGVGRGGQKAWSAAKTIAVPAHAGCLIMQCEGLLDPLRTAGSDP